MEKTTDLVRFVEGAKAGYSASVNANDIYFCTDTRELYARGKLYGISKEDAALIGSSIKSATLSGTTLTLTRNSGSVIEINLASSGEVLSFSGFVNIDPGGAGVRPNSSLLGYDTGEMSTIVYDTATKQLLCRVYRESAPSVALYYSQWADRSNEDNWGGEMKSRYRIYASTVYSDAGAPRLDRVLIDVTTKKMYRFNGSDMVELGAQVVNSLTSTDTSAALSAAQGKVLNDKIAAIGSYWYTA